jgi:hypothetical protein
MSGLAASLSRTSSIADTPRVGPARGAFAVGSLNIPVFADNRDFAWRLDDTPNHAGRSPASVRGGPPTGAFRAGTGYPLVPAL